MQPPTPPPMRPPSPPPGGGAQQAHQQFAAASSRFGQQMAEDQIRRQRVRRGTSSALAPVRAIGFLIKLAVFAVFAVIVVVAIAMARGAFDQIDGHADTGTGTDPGIDTEMPEPAAP